MGTASLLIGLALIIFGVYYLLSPVPATTQIEAGFGTGYRFAIAEEQGDGIVNYLKTLNTNWQEENK